MTSRLNARCLPIIHLFHNSIVRVINSRVSGQYAYRLPNTGKICREFNGLSMEVVVNEDHSTEYYIYLIKYYVHVCLFFGVDDN